eukprot:TRINITY_DN1442_c1_g3_i1.p1 TRINITY_DN1442_c1_g3~~TRINITY_DN1442_c1_g3_i1.p1  ORF type:complete len:1977 (+),score=404.23 TRINITY_DN1442_c1_g3_i1:58-5931(+)
MSTLLNGLSCCIVAGQGEVGEIVALFEKLGGKRAWAGSGKQEMLLSSSSAVADPVNRDRIMGLESKGLKIINAIPWLKECARQQQRVPHLPYILRLPEEELPHTRSSISFFDEESTEVDNSPDIEDVELIEQQQQQQQQQPEETTSKAEPRNTYFQPSGLPAGASNSATLAKFGPSKPISLPGGGFVRKATLEEISTLDSTLHDFRILHMCSMDENKNKFYILELTERGSSHLIITHYGRVGEAGTYDIRMFRSARDAKSYFGQLCTEKYVKKGYRDMSLDSCFVGTKKLQATISEARSGAVDEPEELVVREALSKEVLELVDTIYADANKALSTVLGAELTGEGIRTEIGVLNSEQIRRASSILDQVQVILFSPQDSRTRSSRKKDLLKLSQELYSTIPHKLTAGSIGCAVQPLETISDLTEKRDLLQLMTDVTNAQVCSALANTSDTHKASQKYAALGCSIQVLNPAAEEFRKLQKMTENDVRKCGITLKRAFRVTRPMELAEFEKNVSGRRDLFHGTKASNVLGILRRGLLMPPTSEKSTRQRTNFGWLGSGIYFSDTPCSVTRYADPSTVTGNCFAFVCQVACGNTNQVTEYLPHLTSAPFGYDSVQGMGVEMPSASGSAQSSVFQDNEVVVYRRSQFTIDYLLEMTVERRLPKPKDPPVDSLPVSSEPEKVVGLENDDDRVPFGEVSTSKSKPAPSKEFKNPFAQPLSSQISGTSSSSKPTDSKPATANPFQFVDAARLPSKPAIPATHNPFVTAFGPSQGMESEPSQGANTGGVGVAFSTVPPPASEAHPSSVTAMLSAHEQRISLIEKSVSEIRKSQKEAQNQPAASSVFNPNPVSFGGGFNSGFGANSTGFGANSTGFGANPGIQQFNTPSPFPGFGEAWTPQPFGVKSSAKAKATKVTKKLPAKNAPAAKKSSIKKSSANCKGKEKPKSVTLSVQKKSLSKASFKIPPRPMKCKKVKSKVAHKFNPDDGCEPMRRFKMPKKCSRDVDGQLLVSTIPPPLEINEWILKTEKELRMKFASGDYSGLSKYEFLLNVYSRETIPTFIREPFTPEEASAGKVLTQYVQNQHLGCSSILPMSEFDASLNSMTCSQLEGLDWSNLLMAGGCVLGAMLPDNIGTGESFRGSDMDLFVYGCSTDAEGQQVIERVINCVRRNREKETKGKRVKSKKAPTLQILRTPHAVTILGEYPFRHVQIVLRMYQSPAEVLLGFDVDSCAVGYDGDVVWASPRARRAINKQINTVDLTRRSLTYEIRLAKYAKRGFGVLIPGFDTNYAKRPTLPVKELNGLAKLLALDRDEDNHCALRKHGLNRRVSVKSRTDYSGSTDDEKGLPSDYSNVFLPWGPRWASWKIGHYLENRDKSQYFAKIKSNPSYHAHIAVSGPNALDGFASWCPKCHTEKKTGITESSRPSKEQMGWDDKTDREVDKEASSTFVFGKPHWMRDNPGTQLMTGSFHPVEDDKWMDGTTSNHLVPQLRRFLRDRISANVWEASAPVKSSTPTYPPAQKEITPSPSPVKKAAQIAKPSMSVKSKDNTFDSKFKKKAASSVKMPPLLAGETLMDNDRKLVKKFGTILEIQSPKYTSGRTVGEGTRIVSFSLNDTLIVPLRADRKYSNTDTDWKLKYDQASMTKTLSEATKTGAKIIIFADQPGIEQGYVTIDVAVNRIISIIETLNVPDVICYLSTASDICKKPGTAMFDLFLYNHQLKQSPTDMLYVGSKSTEYDAADWKFAKNCGMEFDQPDVYFNNAAPIPEPTMAFMPNTVTQVIRLWEDQGRAGQTVLKIPEVVKDAELDCSPTGLGIILSGIPKGGKSLYAQNAFRGMNYLVTDYHPSEHDGQQQLQHETRLLLASRMGTSIVFDGRNTTVKNRQPLLDLVKRLKLTPVSVHINTPPAVARHLNLVDSQKFGTRTLDSEIESFCRTFQQPDESEGFEHVEVIPFVPCFENVADEKFFNMFL